MSANRLNAPLFKALFGHREKREVILSLVNAVLSDDGEGPVITQLSLAAWKPDLLDECRIDLIGETSEGAEICMVVQAYERRDIGERNLWCWARICSDTLFPERSPGRISRTVIINLLSARLLEGEAYHTRYGS